MKKIIISFLLLLFCATLSAQNKTVIYGNLGVENVNISVIGTQQGTVTNAKGDYTLQISGKNKRVNLFYSSIGYRDTVVGITPKMLDKDSINISFKMRKKEYALKEVNILAERPHFEGDRHIIIDFEVYDGTVCMLQGSANKYRLLLADENLSVFDTILIPKGIRPEQLLKDCMGNCQLEASDSVYQINLKDKTTPFLATERKRYYAVMENCLFLTDQHLYLKAEAMNGLSTLFYRIDVETKQKQPLFISDGSENITDIKDEWDFQARNPIDLAHPVPGGAWDRFIQMFWFNHNSSHLALDGNTLVYFDHDNNKIHQYSLDMNETSSCTTEYPLKSDWKPRILQDEAKNKFYTFIGYWLHEIDITTGKTTPKERIDVDIYNKVSLWKGHLYILKRQQTSTGKVRSYVERVDL
ncbi:MAG: carboxypeptidase-like regulatory domain-containing protein [Bacteroidales bacterium]|nr:carboxypeptidase-like regulatory domain-containing protein [Bacteroidales bacterium]